MATALLKLAAALSLLTVAEGAVIGITSDIEDCDWGHAGGCDGLLDALGNASGVVAAAGLGLRLSADVSITWSWKPYRYHGKYDNLSRPVHEWIMDIVDEVVLMDYHAGCGESTAAPCNPVGSFGWSFPYLTYAQSQKVAHDREVLVTFGVGVDPFGPPFKHKDRLHTEQQMEVYLDQVTKDMVGCGISRTYRCDAAYGWRQAGPFHKFMVFTRNGYANLTAAWPCPADEPACAKGKRPPRGAWMYLSFPEEKANVLEPARQDALFGWLASHAVNELHLDVGDFLGTPASQAVLAAFIKRLHAAKVDVQLMACGHADVDECVASVQTLLGYVKASGLPTPN